MSTPLRLKTKIKFTCEECGCTGVTRDAVARWGVETQEWEATSIFDNADCDKCGGETNLEETPYDQVRFCNGCDEEFALSHLSDQANGDRLCRYCDPKPKPVPTIEELIEEYDHPDMWGQHPTLTHSEWQTEVAAQNTRRGYWEWVHAKLEEAANG